MSRIYFHSEHGEAAVRGSERAWAGGLCSDLLLVTLHLNGARSTDMRQYLTLFPAEHYLHRLGGDDEWLARSIRTAISVGEEFFTPALNTANVMGSDPVRLLARLHGQCEIHAYVEGPHRAWLADIIEAGREDGIMRDEMGWESVVTLLRERDDCPVVTSYSVCEQFPNAGVAGFTPPEDERGEPNWDAWYDLPDDEQWRQALAGLRASSDGLELSPENWETFYFGDGTTGFDLHKRVQSAAAAAHV